MGAQHCMRASTAFTPYAQVHYVGVLLSVHRGVTCLEQRGGMKHIQDAGKN